MIEQIDNNNKTKNEKKKSKMWHQFYNHPICRQWNFVCGTYLNGIKNADADQRNKQQQQQARYYSFRTFCISNLIELASHIEKVNKQ